MRPDRETELDKSVTTVGEIFVAAAKRVLHRRTAVVMPLRQSFERAIVRPSTIGARFYRREALPRTGLEWAARQNDDLRATAMPPASRQTSGWTPPAEARPIQRHAIAASAARQDDDLRATAMPPASRQTSGWTPSAEARQIQRHAIAASPMHAGRADARAVDLERTGLRSARATYDPSNNAGDEASDRGRPDEPGKPLPADIRDRLADVVGPEVAATRVHHDPGSDVMVRAHRAEAVTIGHDAFFRAGAFRPREPEGLALLAHEATHVVEGLRPGVAWRRSTDVGRREEEMLALAHERSLLSSSRREASAAISARRPPPSGRRAGAAASEQRSLLMTAEIDRPRLDAGSTRDEPRTDLDDMRRALFRDLMAQIRVEFERGA